MIDVLHNSMKILNDSKIFTGIIMLLLNIGSKYVTVKLSKSQEAFLKNKAAREFIIFLVCWAATKDIYISLFLTIAFYIVTEILLHEEHPMCILPHHHKRYHEIHKSTEITQAEINEAVDLLERAKKQHRHKKREEVYNYFTTNKLF
jgi:hypothetical protein